MEDWNTQKRVLKWKTQDQTIEQYTSDIRLTIVADFTAVVVKSS